MAREDVEQADYQRMYDSLFKHVTDALEYLQKTEDLNAQKAVELLKSGQCASEEIYLKSEGTGTK